MSTTLADAPLLATKLFVPPPRQKRVDRLRLREQLDMARGGTMTLLAAPAGSGKSTLLADWALSSRSRVGWISLESDDDEPRRFLNYVVAALANAGAIPSGETFAASIAPDAIDAVMTGILNAVTRCGDNVTLALDDYHAIESESVHGIVQRIVDHIPPNMHLVIASRVDPPLHLSRLRARHLLLEIRSNDLRFTTDEAASFLNEAMGLGLSQNEIAELEERTEGWAVGLQMAAISLRGLSGATDFISSFSGSNRYVLDYLTEEVLQRQPEEIRSFLVETSILTQLSPPLCDAVLGRSDSQRILEQLDAANLFLIPLDKVRFWYRYHHLFASLLQHELERSARAERIDALHRSASEWFESKGLAEIALHHALASRDDDRAAGIVLRHAGSRIDAGDGATVVRWISQLPRTHVERDVDLMILHVRALTTEYEVDRALQEVLSAESKLTFENRERYEGPLLSLRGMLERLAGNAERGTATLERAMSMLERSGFWYSMNALHLGMVALLQPDLATADRYLRLATASHERVDGLMTSVFGQCYGGWVALWRGFPDEAIACAQEADRWVAEWDATRHTGRRLSALAWALIADTHRMRNELVAARECAERALDYGRKGFFIGYAESTRVLAQLALAEGNWDAAIDSTGEAIRAIRCSGNPDWLNQTRALEYETFWRRGKATGNHHDLDKVEEWCTRSEMLGGGDWRERIQAGLCGDAGLTLAVRVLIRRERYSEAKKLAEALFARALSEERVPSQITLLVLRSIAEAGGGDIQRGVDTMTRALDLASAPRFIRFVLDEGSEVLPLVERAASGVADRDFATSVLAAFDVPVKTKLFSDDSLSEREIEVLQLIATGASNQAAARKLFIAPSTVKKHLENIYAKLGVGGRIEAIARARELRLLS